MKRWVVAFCLLGPGPAMSPAGDGPRPEPRPRLKVRLEVSTNLAGLLVAKDGKVTVKGGSEVTILRGAEVELLAVDRPLSGAIPDDPKLPADVVRLHVQQNGAFPAMLAAPPSRFGRGGKELGMHVPYVSIAVRGLGVSNSYQTSTNLRHLPKEEDWAKLRREGLEGVDGHLRAWLGEGLVRRAEPGRGEKAGWVVENPHPFAVSGKAILRGEGKDGRQVPFRLEPGAAPQWVDAGHFLVGDLAVYAPAAVRPKK